ncbi:MAG: HTH-type transcriptional regulator/antitoxin HigA [Saprospiraceae bacterium]|jgi:HTH-type transcriptional regulator/antitoxin HigA
MKYLKHMKIISSEEEYKNALDAVYGLMDSKEGTPEIEYLDIISLLIEQYEEIHYPISNPDPIEAIKFRMEEQGINVTQLGKIIGYKSRASEILHKKRKLTLPMIRSISKELNISTEVLIQEY